LTYSRQADPIAIHNLFKRLWPLETGHELSFCGGYLFPRNIGEIDVIFSPGVGPTSDFEFEFAKKGIACYLADASVDGPSIEHANFNFIKKYIGSETKENFICFRDWIVSNYPSGNDAVLQMDIEAGEYESILSLDDAFLARFKVIVIEVHNLNFLTSQEGFVLGNIFFNHLLNNFEVTHFHTNNYIRPIRFKGIVFPSDIELVLIRKDLCLDKKPVNILPHHLDKPSNPLKKDPAYHKNFLMGIIKDC